MVHFLGEVTLSFTYLLPFSREVYSQIREFAHHGANCLTLKLNPSLEVLGQRKSRTLLNNSRSKNRVKHGGVPTLNITEIQYNFSASNTDGSFTTAVSNSFLGTLEQIPQLQIWDNLI